MNQHEEGVVGSEPRRGGGGEEEEAYLLEIIFAHAPLALSLAESPCGCVCARPALQCNTWNMGGIEQATLSTLVIKVSEQV